jgi:hypothetical protein
VIQYFRRSVGVKGIQLLHGSFLFFNSANFRHARPPVKKGGQFV